MNSSDGRRRVVVEGVTPAIDCGRFAIKRVTGDTVTVEADVFADGHDVVTGVLGWRRHGTKQWTETPMENGIRVTSGVELTARDAPSSFVQLDQVVPLARGVVEFGDAVGESWRGAPEPPQSTGEAGERQPTNRG